MTMTIPTIPSMPAGHVATVADMAALSAACTFLLTKPIAKIVDTTGAQSLSTGGTVINFSSAVFDTDGMWNVSNPDRLTVQTPGWYKLRYMINVDIASPNNGVARSTTGPNNPAGAGSTSSNYWAGYTGQAPGHLQGHGLWPFFLYAGDFIQVLGVEASGSSTKTGVHDLAGTSGAGSYLSLEYVSCS